MTGKGKFSSAYKPTLLRFVAFVFRDLPFNLFVKGTHIRPRVRKVLGAKSGISLEKIDVACAEQPRLLQKPDRNSSPHNAGNAAGNSGAAD
jgi:hypothetical protein